MTDYINSGGETMTDDLTKEILTQIKQNPKEFLNRSCRIEQQVQVKRRRIDNLRRISTQITTTIKAASTYTGPGDKVGDCVVEILT